MGRVVRTVRDRASVGNPETFKSGGSVLHFHTRELKLAPPPLPPNLQQLGGRALVHRGLGFLSMAHGLVIREKVAVSSPIEHLDHLR
jgi:hypothetical protein